MDVISGILWDNDGVLVDTERLFYEVNRDFFRGYGIELSEENFFEWFLCTNHGAWHLLAERGATKQRIDACRTVRNKRYIERLTSETGLLKPGVEKVLRHLTGRVAMGIVTSASRQHFDAIHNKTDIAKYFRFALIEETYSHSKPSPEPHLLGLRWLELQPHQCLVVEDSPRGLQSALAAGIRCIVLRNSMTRHHHFEGAYRVVDSMDELLGEVEALM